MARFAEKRIIDDEAGSMQPEQTVKAAHVASPVGLVQANRGGSAEPEATVRADDDFIAEEAELAGVVTIDEDELTVEDEVAVEAEAENVEIVEGAGEVEEATEVAEAAEATASTEAELGEAAPSLVSPDADDADETELRSTRPEELRLLEALLFAATEPLETSALAKRVPEGVDIKAALAQLQDDYALRGVNLVRVAGKWTFRTAYDLAWLMTRESKETRKLSRAAVEMLAIVAYHQPVTRAEIEDIRGVVTSKGTLDVLLETGWIRPRGRRKTPGRPLTFGTTESFLSQFNLETLGDLPGLEELKGTGLLDSRLPSGFSVPNPSDDPALREDEDPLEIEDLQLALAPAVEPEEQPGPDAGQADATRPTED